MENWGYKWGYRTSFVNQKSLFHKAYTSLIESDNRHHITSGHPSKTRLLHWRAGFFFDFDGDEIDDMNHNFEISEFKLPSGAAPLACVDIGGTRIAVSVVDVLTEAGASVDLEGLAARFSGRGRWRERLPTILDTLVALGRARTQGDGRWVDAGR